MQGRLSLALIIGAAAITSGQNSDDKGWVNPAQDILSCDALPCARQDNNSLCALPGASGVGAGFVPRAVNVSNSASLSLTLIDGSPQGTYQESQEMYEYSTRTLYVGASQDTDLSRQSPGCALMMQHQATTFPYPSGQSSRYSPNSTTCPSDFLYDNITPRDISSYIRDFQYSNSSSPGSRCEGLAEYVEGRIHAQLTFGAYYAALVSVSGGSVSGPGVNTQVAKLGNSTSGNSNSCQPVSPESYRLHNVTSMTEILRGNSVSQNSTIGGRSGYTPVVSVLYGNDGSSDPSVQFYCMHIYQTNGQELPYSQIDRLSSAGHVARLSSGLALLALIATASTVL